MIKRKNILKIAIDSPAAAGAGTLAKSISEHYNLFYLDTGKIYRFIAYLKIRFPKNPGFWRILHFSILAFARSTEVRPNPSCEGSGVALALLENETSRDRKFSVQISKVVPSD